MKDKVFENYRADFPILNRLVQNGLPLVYLDSAATSQKPVQVINSISDFFNQSNANIHRGIHTLAEEATYAYEGSRKKLAAFINAPSPRNVIFTRNTTEAINLVAHSWGKSTLKSGDVIVLTEMEHHSNLVPWQMLAADIDIKLEFIPITSDHLLDMVVYKNLLKKKPKLVSFTHMSNVLGTINPVAEMISLAHQSGAITLLDGAQSVPHFPVDVQYLNVDFLAFSGHKMCGPSGIGILYGKKELLDNMPPFMGGGDMIKKVYLQSYTPNEVPYKFEAGTPAIAEAVGLGVAVDYLNDIGMGNIAEYERELMEYCLSKLWTISGIIVHGPSASHKGGVVSFSLDGVHPHDISQVLDSYGIAVRAGHHCAMPLHDRLNIPASTRASFYFYNNFEEVDKLVEALKNVKKLFRV